MREQVGALGDQADAAAVCRDAAARAGEQPTGGADLAVVEGEQAGDGVDDGGLAGTVRADQGDALGRSDVRATSTPRS